VTCGIPDFRTIGDPYLSVADDVAAAATLAGRDERLSFGTLYSSYYEGNANVSAEQVARFTHGVLAAADRSSATLATWRELGATFGGEGLVLEIGCGTAPLGVALASAGCRVVAIDAGLRWLVLARSARPRLAWTSPLSVPTPNDSPCEPVRWRRRWVSRCSKTSPTPTRGSPRRDGSHAWAASSRSRRRIAVRWT